MPERLVPQIPYIHKLVQGFRIPGGLWQDGQEADDVIATLAIEGSRGRMDVVIVTGIGHPQLWTHIRCTTP